MRCLQCEAEMVTRREDVDYDELGLSGVTLVQIEVSRCPKCGEYEVAIPRIEELHRVLAFAVAEQRARLVGEEVRFLRKYLGYSAQDFAETIGVDPSTVSRWENDKEPIGTMADRLLRLMVFRQKPIEEYPTQKLADVAREQAHLPKLRARTVGDSWQTELSD